jgi:hypothetical protein
MCVRLTLSAGSKVASRAHTFAHTFESASGEFWRCTAEHRSQLTAENHYKSRPNEHQRSLAKAIANVVMPAAPRFFVPIFAIFRAPQKNGAPLSAPDQFDQPA